MLHGIPSTRYRHSGLVAGRPEQLGLDLGLLLLGNHVLAMVTCGLVARGLVQEAKDVSLLEYVGDRLLGNACAHAKARILSTEQNGSTIRT